MLNTKGGQMPKAFYEKKMDNIKCCDEKYASQSTMDNPEDLKRSADALAAYVRKNKMKY